MASARRKAWWDEVPPQVGGDAMIVTVGDGAHNVAIGKVVGKAGEVAVAWVRGRFGATA